MALGSRQENNINECCVLGCLLVEPDLLEDVERILTIADFSDELCAETFRAFQKIRDSGKLADLALVRAEVNKAAQDDCTQFLIGCMNITPTTANLKEYCNLVKEDANNRRAARIGRDINEAVYGGASADEVVELAQSRIDEISGGGSGDVLDGGSMVLAWGDYNEKVRKNPEFAYCKTGYESLDQKLGGGMFRAGMYIVGARPGMGKTTLGINIAENISKFGKPVMFVSLEMGRVQIMAKRIGCSAGLPYTQIMNGTLPEQRVQEELPLILDVLSKRPFYMTDKSKLTVVEIGRAARKIKDISAIVIDYLGLLGVAQDQQRKTRYEQVTNISADIKALAKVLNIPIIVLCQLNRESVRSADKKPSLTDLRDSGAIEQDADAVILLHRPEYFNKEKEDGSYIPPQIEDIELIVAKNRHFETGTVKLKFRGSTGEILSSVDRYYQTDEPPF